MITTDRPVCIAIMAMGGQGGGVLSDWIVAMAEAAGFVAQSTSVPGVAQRTGATIYYVELIRARPGHHPVLSLMPVPGDVDVVIAAELMEAGRAIQRGLVSPDRTTLIASSHRALSVPEKAKPGDGIADPTQVYEAARALSARFLCADMQGLAERQGSMISAALFGALAASGTLPFDRAAFEAVVRAAGIGVEASLRAFAAGHDAVLAPAATEAVAPAVTLPAATGGTPAERAEFARALQRIAAEFPETAHTMLGHGVARLVGYQDIAYAHEYLDRVARLARFGHAGITTEAARQIAVAMSYDDVIRVADLKTRTARAGRVRAEMAATPDQLVATTEFMHPRLEEICAILPTRLGLFVERSTVLARPLRVIIDRGRRVRTDTLLGFVPLYLLAGLRRRRRGLLRHGREMAHLAAWLALAERHAPDNPKLTVEILKCRRLVKGYSDTHARGTSKFDRVMAALPALETRPDAADWVRRLRDAALMDEAGTALNGALATVASLGA